MLGARSAGLRLIWLFLLVGCGVETSGDPSGASVTIDLELAGGSAIDEVSYVVTGSDMEPMGGVIDTSAPGSTASVELFGIAPGQGYLVTMSATSVDGTTTCAGAAPFDVTAETVTRVSVFLGCKRPSQFGGVRVNGHLNVCAELAKAVVSPLQTSTNDDIDLSAQAVDAEGDSVGYRWTATGGSIADPGSAETTFTCSEPGDQLITIEVSDDGFVDCVDGWTVNVTCTGEAGGEHAPLLVGSDPAPGSQTVRSAWLTLDFEEAVADDVLGIFELSCGGSPQPSSAHRLRQNPTRLIINPAGDLPTGADCELEWTGPEGPEALPFSVFGQAPPAIVRYDRRDPSMYVPFPDDMWLEPDASTHTGVHVSLPVTDREPDVVNVMTKIKQAAEGSAFTLDGFSPLGPFVVELSTAPVAASLPTDQTASLDPLATVALFDLTEGSAAYGERVPFKLHIRAARTFNTATQYAIVIFPAIPLTPGGRYGLVITKRALAAPDQPFDPSAFTEAAQGEALDGEDESVPEARALMNDVISVVSQASPPIFGDDVALALRMSIRSTEDFPITQATMKQNVLDLPPPSVQITSVQPDTGEVAALVKGTWQAPEWRVNFNIARFADGTPVVIKQKPIPFILAIPRSADSTPAPIVMYQHGNPGSAENEVPWQARGYLAENGFAVAGFTDTISRDVGSDTDLQNTAVMGPLFSVGVLPDFWYQTTGEQLSFIRMLSTLDDLDVLPLGAPDGQPDLDVSVPPAYLGLSEGANKGQAFVPYAPEVHAAVLLVGGMRLSEVLFYQDIVNPSGVGTELLDTLNGLIAPNLRPLDLWVGLGVFQLAFDPQDPHNHAAFMYRNPIEVAGTLRKPSVLVQEGIGDTLVPNNATRSLAYTLGVVPHIEPVQVPVPYLPTAPGPIVANIDAQTTAAFAQYVPAGIPGLEPTPTCELQPEGHYCAQIAEPAIDQRVQFFLSTLTDPAPIIVNPFD
jgi:hypothetical protein